MSDVHLTIDRIGELRRGELSANAARAAIAHLEDCAECREKALRTKEIRQALEMFDEELRGAGSPTRRSTNYLALAAAAAIAIIGLALWFGRPPSVAPTPPRTIRVKPLTEWDRLVADVRRNRTIPMPAVIKELRGESDKLRGEHPDALDLDMQPAGVVVASRQPELTWRAAPRERYTVTIECGNAVAAQSRPVAGGSWTPLNPLPRGTNCAWALERLGDHAILPPPTEPQPAFRVLDEPALANIQEAEKQRPDDDFLIALLYARAGVRKEAEEHLRKYVAAHPADDAARSILHDMKGW